MAIIEVPVKEAIKDPKATKTAASSANQVREIKSKERTGIYKHLMTGVSFMLPSVVAGGILIALGFAFGGIYVYKVPGSFAETIFSTGKAAFALFIPIFGGFISYSISDRPDIVVGMVSGFLANANGSGFIGVKIAGFATGYIVLAINNILKFLNQWQVRCQYLLGLYHQ